MAAIAQSSPGAIAINLSALAGYQVAGLGGVLVSCVAALLPPLLILGAVSAFYRVFIANAVVAAVLKGMEAGVAALMVDLIVDTVSYTHLTFRRPWSAETMRRVSSSWAHMASTWALKRRTISLTPSV